MILTIIAFLIVLTVLIFVHELGHFLAAKSFKIRVDEFAIGFPPKLWSKMLGKTRFAINLVPLGGYVKIHGEDPNDQISDDSILAKKKWQQIVVLVAGVFFNILLAWLLISTTLVFGTQASAGAFPPSKVQDPKLLIVMVAPSGPADKAGLKSGDEILSITSSKEVLASTSLSVAGVQKVIQEAPSTLAITVMRKNEASVYKLEPAQGIVAGKQAIGISMDLVGKVKVNPFQALWYGAVQTKDLTIAVTEGLGKFIGNIFVGKGSFKEVTGPVGLAGIVGDSARTGLNSLLILTAIISINLAVINMVPFPALDGGRVVVVLIEGIIRRPLNPKVIGIINAVGFILLILLMVIVSIKDVVAIFK